MLGWVATLLAAISATILVIIILFILIRRRFTSSKQQSVVTNHQETTTTTTRRREDVNTAAFQAVNRKGSYHMFRRGSSTKPVVFFNWADHPTLITDAVENGWSRFAFTNYTPSPSVRSSLFGGNFSLRENNNQAVEVSWELGQESVDFMQKIRLNSGLINKIHGFSNVVPKSTIRMGLPLPGPPTSFPQEAYFEITILNSNSDDETLTQSMGKRKGGEGEKMKLINSSSSLSSSTGNGNLESLADVSRAQMLEELKIGGGRRREGVRMTLGLTVGGSPTAKIPGSYPGSIGFNSNGSVCLGGTKLVFESEKEDWAQTGKVIGCGFNPRQKKVFFTVDSEVIHEIHCKSEDFGMPLYPIIAANTEITVLVNLGQSCFNYSPANAHRTPNPCFIGPVVNSSPESLGYEDDSKEFFSMGRIDSKWLNHSATVRSTISDNNSNNNHNKTVECDDESEADLFEIVWIS